jgi:hypothetical protein
VATQEPARVTGSWKPRSWRDKVCGCYWLGRMIDKGRRKLESREAGADLLDGYQFGDHNPTDAIMLRFLGLKGADVLEILREEKDDEAAGAAILARSHRDAAAVERWNRWFSRLYKLVLVGIDADEGRVPPTAGNTLIKLIIRHVIQPPAAAWYRLRSGGS